MGRHDADGKRIKWTKAEKRMVKEMREAGLMPGRPILDLRSKAERLGKLPMNYPSAQDRSYPPHLCRGQRRTMRVRSVIVVPNASDEGPSSVPIETAPTQNMEIQEAPEGPYISPAEANAVAPNEESYDEPGEENTAHDADMMTCNEEDMTVDNASEIHEDALVKYVPDDKTFLEAFITDEWEKWMPQFYPLYEGPAFPLSDLPRDAIMGINSKLKPKGQARFLTIVGSDAKRPEVQLVLFQLKRVQRRLFHLMGEWAYYIRWIQPRELARNIPIIQDRIDCAYRHYVRLNRDTQAERMTINDIARVWGVYGTELREEIDWQDGGGQWL